MPKVSPRNLPETCGQTAQNCWLTETTLEPIHSTSTGSPGILGTLVLAGNDAVYGPIADDQYSRIYYTDGTTLHMNYNSGTIVTDVSKSAPSAPTITKSLLFSPYAINLQRTYSGGTQVLTYMGYTISGSTLTLRYSTGQSDRLLTDITNIYSINYSTGSYTTLPTSDTIALENDITMNILDMVLSEDQWHITVTCSLNCPRSAVQYQYYVQTTVDALGQESPPSAISAMVEWNIFEKLTIAATTGGRLYRSATGAVDSDFFFLAENPGLVYVDSTVDASLAEKMPLIENPPTAMSGLVSMPGGFLAAFNGKDIYFSEPWLPYSWPTRYRLTVDYEVVGLAVQGNDLIVLTKGNPYYISGSHPEIMTQTKLPINQSCVAKSSIAFAERFVCYASPDGLVSLSGGMATIITQDLYTRDQWQALQPTTMIGAVHDRRYIGFANGGSIIVDFMDGQARLTTTDVTATALFSDLETDYLYMSDSRIWRGSSTHLVATWKSKEFQNVQDAIWNSAKVIATSYTNTVFKIYSAGTLVWTYTVTSDSAFRVPKLDRSARWSIQIETQDVIHEVAVASCMTLLRTLDGIKQ